MELKLKNIGKLNKADIKIDGITIIAGKNNTGKSTVGKALYCIFSSLYDVDKKIEEDRKDYIRREIAILFRKDSFFIYRIFNENYKDIVEKIIKKIVDRDFYEAKKQVLFIFQDIKDKSNQLSGLKKFKIPNDDDIDNVFNNIEEALKIPNKYFYMHRLENIFNEEFNGQINNVNTDLKSSIELIIKNKKINLCVEDDIFQPNTYMDLESDVVYIDSPFVLDNIEYIDCDDLLSHKCNVINKLIENIKDNNMTADIIFQEKLTLLIKKLDDIGVGKLIQDNEGFNNQFKYQSKYDKKPIEITNISAGLKTFIILKTLILNGHIQEKGCIILDEPEIHLHPEWQLVFAELIVLLQKTFNLHILLNTHSPYFLRAIQVYSAKYEISDRCNYYLAENALENNIATIRDVSDNTNEIYKLLYYPFQQLDDEPYYEN